MVSTGLVRAAVTIIITAVTVLTVMTVIIITIRWSKRISGGQMSYPKTNESPD